MLADIHALLRIFWFMGHFHANRFNHQFSSRHLHIPIAPVIVPNTLTKTVAMFGASGIAGKTSNNIQVMANEITNIDNLVAPDLLSLPFDL